MISNRLYSVQLQCEKRGKNTAIISIMKIMKYSGKWGLAATATLCASLQEYPTCVYMRNLQYPLCKLKCTVTAFIPFHDWTPAMLLLTNIDMTSCFFYQCELEF